MKILTVCGEIAAYGWDDISTDCYFLLDYEIDEDNWSPRKKKPWRYRWPDTVCDEVLARLLELSQKRYEGEVLAGLHDKPKPKAKIAGKSKSKNLSPHTDVGTLSLFDGLNDQATDS